MNRRISDCLRPALRLAPWGALAAVLLGLVGCKTPSISNLKQQARLQAGDENETERYGLKTVGEVTSVGNADPIPLGGVGLVVGLDGTGGDPAPDNYRTMLEEQLTKDNVKDVKKELADPTHALVVVTAQYAPGAVKGDPMDVVVSLPPHSGKATSLRGGYLCKCVLSNYDYTKHLNPNYNGPDVALPGLPCATCEGPVLVGLGDGDEADRVKHGRIWGGGKCLRPNPLLLLLNPGYQQARVAMLAATRINEALHGGTAESPDDATAVASNNLAIELHAPPAYKLNLPRFLRVVRLVPLQNDMDEQGRPVQSRPYAQRLAEDLLDPARTVTAALRLEALGQQSVPILKTALQSTHPLVRFCAAESLAYLDCPAGGEELGAAVVKQPLLRAFALTALASLDESVSHTQLRDLLLCAADEDVEARYGAFRALRALNDEDPLVQGDFLNNSFWLHRVAPDCPPLIHISTTRRPEIVLFGQEPIMRPPFSLLAGQFAVTATDDDRCTISRFPPQGGVQRKQCSLKMDDLFRTMADMGGTYAEALELLQQARRCDCLSCPVRADALPQAVSVIDLARAAQSGDELNAQGQIVVAPQDLGATPTLFSGK
ncbi:MAG TPA: flagellar basal body P-ring protein FlgI [Gemmataceae bacterium]|nr:flagellar basal body P-ring protein FlgI [Gemmataceae bacterium]